METIKNSESQEITLTNSWVVLGTNDDTSPEVPEDAQEKIKTDLSMGRNEGTPEKYEDLIQSISDTNNKSDAESDGISIISESEFYQSKSDDDVSTNSSDENLVDDFKNRELPDFLSEHVDQLLESHEIPMVDGISDISSLINEDSNILEKSNARTSSEPDFDKNNLEPKKFMTKELVDSFKLIFKYNRMCFISTLILAITVSYISSKLDQKEIQEDVEKKYLEITKKELLNEKEKLKNWHANLARERRKFKEWENKLLEMEQKLYGTMKNKESVDSGSKIKSKNAKKRKVTKKIDGFRPDRSFEDEKGYKKYKIRNKKINALNSENQRYKQTSSTFDNKKNVRGEWYFNLLRGRMQKREKDDKAGWWFDRASFRNIKRNKAYWYFQYMVNREDLRYHLKSKTKNI